MGYGLTHEEKQQVWATNRNLPKALHEMARRLKAGGKKAYDAGDRRLAGEMKQAVSTLVLGWQTAFAARASSPISIARNTAHRGRACTGSAHMRSLGVTCAAVGTAAGSGDWAAGARGERTGEWTPLLQHVVRDASFACLYSSAALRGDALQRRTNPVLGKADTPSSVQY